MFLPQDDMPSATDWMMFRPLFHCVVVLRGYHCWLLGTAGLITISAACAYLVSLDLLAPLRRTIAVAAFIVRILLFLALHCSGSGSCLLSPPPSVPGVGGMSACCELAA
jgi:hypothetical protein